MGGRFDVPECLDLYAHLLHAGVLGHDPATCLYMGATTPRLRPLRERNADGDGNLRHQRIRLHTGREQAAERIVFTTLRINSLLLHLFDVDELHRHPNPNLHRIAYGVRGCTASG